MANIYTVRDQEYEQLLANQRLALQQRNGHPISLLREILAECPAALLQKIPP